MWRPWTTCCSSTSALGARHLDKLVLLTLTMLDDLLDAVAQAVLHSLVPSIFSMHDDLPESERWDSYLSSSSPAPR